MLPTPFPAALFTLRVRVSAGSGPGTDLDPRQADLAFHQRLGHDARLGQDQVEQPDGEGHHGVRLTTSSQTRKDWGLRRSQCLLQGATTILRT